MQSYGDFRHAHPGWRVELADLPDGENGRTTVSTKTIQISRRLDQAAQRSTLFHEIVHAEHGHVDCSEWEEEQVELAAARILLPLEMLLYVLPWCRDMGEAADECWVDMDMLQTRVEHLHPSERAAIVRAFAARDNRCQIHAPGECAC